MNRVLKSMTQFVVVIKRPIQIIVLQKMQVLRNGLKVSVNNEKEDFME